MVSATFLRFYKPGSRKILNKEDTSALETFGHLKTVIYLCVRFRSSLHSWLNSSWRTRILMQTPQ